MLALFSMDVAVTLVPLLRSNIRALPVLDSLLVTTCLDLDSPPVTVLTKGMRFGVPSNCDGWAGFWPEARYGDIMPVGLPS